MTPISPTPTQPSPAHLKPPFPYFGGKQRLAPQIVELFPEHSGYVEPYCGALSVLLNKPIERNETVNDINGDLITFWRVLRDRPDEFIRAVQLTPHSLHERTIARDRANLTDVEVARRVWVNLTQGRSASWGRTGWRCYHDPDAVTYAMVEYLQGYRDRLPALAERILNVSLESRPALDVIADYGKHPGNLLYVDPPYLGARDGGVYGDEINPTTEDAHWQLLDALNECKAKIILSGYPSDLYTDALSHWQMKTLKASTQSGRTGGSGVSRHEVVWMNYHPDVLLF